MDADSPTETLKLLVNKKFVFLAESGDHAIKSVFQNIKNFVNTILIQDQGGWLTYNDYAKKEKLNIIELKTDYGIINMQDLEAKTNEKTALLVNSLTGYCAEQPMKKIQSICSRKKCLLINDVSGSIGTENAKIGDIILCSFGKDKPVNLHYGGFIATDNNHNFENCKFDEQKIEELTKQLNNLKKRLDYFEVVHNKIKNDLSAFEIIHKYKRGINVIVKFNNEKEKHEIIDYCKKNMYNYTLCPRQIRVLEDAISIEVKRMVQK